MDVEASTLLCVRGVLASAYWPGSAVSFPNGIAQISEHAHTEFYNCKAVECGDMQYGISILPSTSNYTESTKSLPIMEIFNAGIIFFWIEADLR